MPEPEVIDESKVEDNKVFLGGMGGVIDSYMAKPGDEDYVEPKPDEDVVDELKFGDEGYILKPGDEGYVEPEPEAIDYSTFEKDDLVNKVIEFEKLASEREQSISQLQTDLEGKSSVEDDELVKSLSEDFLGNYDKVKEKYNLPTLDTLKDLMSEGATVDDKIKVWQENELVSAIEQKHSLEKGEFEYDSNEASRAGTPSYDWDTQTSDKRLELVSTVKERQGAEASRLRAVENQQKEDVKWLATEYYETEEAVNEKVSNMNITVDDIAKGVVSADKHPLAVRNLIRGFYFDELVSSAVDKAVEDLTNQYAQHNMHLPDKELPTDVTKVKATPAKAKDLDIPEKTRKFSPMMNSIFNTAKN